MFINTNPDLEGMKGLEVARVKCFFFPSDTIGLPHIHVLLFIGLIRSVTLLMRILACG
jgi:hypothetical protein